jgi:hypothetical protein
MSSEIPNRPDSATDVAPTSHDDDTAHRGRTLLRRDRRSFSFRAASSWLLARFIEGFIAYGAATFASVAWFEEEPAPTSETELPDKDTRRKPLPRP